MAEKQSSADKSFQEPLKLFYSEDLKRLFISERVSISNNFENHGKIDHHVAKYTKKLE